MRTVIVGGGQGCRQIIKLVQESILEEIQLDIIGVVDPDPSAPGMLYARECGIKTFDEMRTALQVLDVELILELTGHGKVVDEIYKLIPTGIRVIDHTFARIFWDMGRIQRFQKKQLSDIIELEKKLAAEQDFLQSLVDKIPDMVLVMTPDLKIVKVNSSFSEFFSLQPEEVIARDFNEVFGRLHRPRSYSGK
jgi:PAS domain-containing protein